jgi:hypothetical protein
VLSDLIKKIEKISAKIRRRLVSPRSQKISKLLGVLFNTLSYLNKYFFSNKSACSEYIAIYDLRSHSVSYDFCYFLMDAEIYFSKKMIFEFDLFILIPPSFDDRSNEYLKYISSEDINLRIYNLIVPVASMNRCIRNISVKSCEPSLNNSFINSVIYPKGYCEYFNPSMHYSAIHKNIRDKCFHNFEAPSASLKDIKNWKIQNGIEKPLITITLRSYGFDAVRNSNIKEWDRFSKLLIKAGFEVCVVPDTIEWWSERNEFEGCFFLKEASVNLYLRTALYESAELNFFYSNGVHALSVIDHRINSIIFSPILDGSLEASNKVQVGNGIDYSESDLGVSSARNVFLYLNDDLENLIKSIKLFYSKYKILNQIDLDSIKL